MATPALSLTATLHPSQLDARRGVVRLHPNVLSALGLTPWDPIGILGTRVTGALVAFAPESTPHSVVLMDDLTCANAGVIPGENVKIGPAQPAAATAVHLTGGSNVPIDVDPSAIRLALLGKVLAPGDNVSLLPQDFSRPGGTDAAPLARVVSSLAEALGARWTSVLLNVASLEPAGLVRVTMETAVSWDAIGTAGSGTPLLTTAAPSREGLPGLEDEFTALAERLEVGFHQTELLDRLGARSPLGILLTGPPGSGKVSLIEAVVAHVGARLHRLWGPALARADTGDALTLLKRTMHDLEAKTPAVLLIEDVDAILPATDAGPLLTVILEQIERLVAKPDIAVICTTAHPEATCSDLRRPGLLDHEIELPLPTRDERRRMLDYLCRSLPLNADVRLDDVSGRTPGFVAADLLALTREAALRAAQRIAAAKEPPPHTITMADLDAALEVVRPSSLDTERLEMTHLTLEDVGDMEPVKKVLTETVIWPLTYPDTFTRLGVEPARGVLLYGPPGCGKTFLIKALAGGAQANFMSVKGAELLSKWVGESERAVRELFRRARNAAPVLLFFDEVDALAPVRGHGNDGGTTDRVVAQLLTELDGVEDLRGVFVVGATNRPELVDPAMLRPGRLERLVYVPPPDEEARVAIMRTVVRKMPLAKDLDVEPIARAAVAYSAADLEALAREAALTAMREDMDSPSITADHFAAAATVVRPSLRPDVVERLERFAAERSSA